MRLSRYTFPSLLAAVAVGACAPAAPSASPSQPTGPALAADQSLVVGMNSMSSTWDPMVTTGSNPRRYGTYEALIGQSDDGKYEPGIATKWEMRDPTTIRLTLTDGRLFHDGTQLTSEDVVFTVARAVDPAKRYAILTRIGSIASATAIDKLTVEIKTSQPEALLVSRIAALPILPKAYLERVGDKTFEEKPIGSGPFKVTTWVTQDRVVLERHEGYNGQKPVLQKLTVRVIPEATARFAGLRTGELDVINQLPFDNVDQARSGGYNIISFDTGYSWGAWLDTLIEGSPTRDTRVRQAINYAIDKETLLKAVYRGLTVLEQGQIVQRETFGFNPNLKPYPYDPARAKTLIAAAGYPNGFTIKCDAYFFNAEARQVWPYLIDQLKTVGITCDVNQYSDSSNNSDRFFGRVARAPITGVSVTNVPAADADFAIAWFSNKQIGGAKRYDNAEFQRWYDLSVVELDRAKRETYLQNALKAMHDDPPYLYLVQGAVLWVHTNKVGDLNKRVDADPNYVNAKKLA
jgi:peptide/nickel transport system substrate-binding protein